MHINTSLLCAISMLLLATCASNPETAILATVQTGNPSIVELMKRNENLPVDERVALYLKYKKESHDAFDFGNEDELNMYGYAHLWSDKITDAIAIFKLLVSQFPESANAYDSLGEAYLANGNTEESLVNYRKSLELNPDNFGAEDQIDRILFPNKPILTPAEQFAKVYPAADYKADLDQLGNTILEVHPNALKFISEQEFWELIETKKGLINERTTYAEFCWHCSEIVASIGCSHTTTGGFYPEDEMIPIEARFPLQVRWINDRLFVMDALNNGKKVSVKDEIERINGVPVQDLVSDIFKHIPAQGRIKTTQKYALNASATGMIPFALGFPETYELAIKGNPNPVVLNPNEAYAKPYHDQSIKRCFDNLCLEFLSDKKSAIMTVSSFNFYSWNDLPVFQEFMDQSFTKIKKAGIENLIIDVRFNGGGSSESSAYLLRYLAKEPFTYFKTAEFEGKTEKLEEEYALAPFENSYKGKLFFIIDGIGNSTTGHFMSIAKELELGTIVGEELGSNQYCTAGQVICRLSNTKFQYYVANNTHISAAQGLPDDRGILPDYYVTQSVDDVLNRVDVVKEFTVGLTKN